MKPLDQHLLPWLDQEIKGVTEIVMKLIEEDAPKNKFSIQTGKLRALEDVKAEIEKFLQQPIAS